MCRRVQCKTCHRPSYAGCGRHVEQVLGDVAPADRCRCAEERAATPKAPREKRTWFWSRGAPAER